MKYGLILLIFLASCNPCHCASPATEKARKMAATGRLSHAGKLAGRYEGIGFSSRSKDAAIRSCCYWGRKTPVDIGTARGRRGWYACVGYR